MTSPIRQTLSRLATAAVLVAALATALLTGAPRHEAVAAAPAQACYPEAVAADSPRAHWRLDEGSGSTLLDSAGSQHGTFVGGPALGAPGALGDPAATSVDFDGLSQNAVVPDSNLLDTGDTFTYEAWIKRDALNGTENVILAKAGNGPMLYLDAAGRVVLARENTGTVIATSTAAIADTTSFHHVVATKSGATSRVYINGIDRTGTVSNLTLQDTTDPLYIGREAAPRTSWFDGRIDEAAIYATALSPARVQAHYAARTCGSTPPAPTAQSCYPATIGADDPRAYWRMAEGSGSTLEDSIGQRDGAYVGSPTLGVQGPLFDALDKAVTFNGVDQFAEVPDSPWLDVGDTFTYEIWLRRATIGGGDQMLMTKGGNTAGLLLGGNDNLLKLFKEGGPRVVASTVAITDTDWHHVVATKSGAAVKLYIDGVDRTGAVTNQTMVDNNNSFALGQDAAERERFSGSLDEAALYDTALPAARVLEHYRAADCARPPAPPTPPPTTTPPPGAPTAVTPTAQPPSSQQAASDSQLPPGAAASTTAPAIGVRLKASEPVRVDRRGKARFAVRCAKRIRCRGTVKIYAQVRSKPRGKAARLSARTRRVLIARGRYNVAAGKRGAVTVTISRRARRRLLRNRTQRCRVSLSSNGRTLSRDVRLRLAGN